jgi:hypothetical protein
MLTTARPVRRHSARPFRRGYRAGGRAEWDSAPRRKGYGSVYRGKAPPHGVDTYTYTCTYVYTIRRRPPACRGRASAARWRPSPGFPTARSVSARPPGAAHCASRRVRHVHTMGRLRRVNRRRADARARTDARPAPKHTSVRRARARARMSTRAADGRSTRARA